MLQCALEPSQESPALLVSLQNYVREHYEPALSCSIKKGTCFPSTVLEAIQCLAEQGFIPMFLPSFSLLAAFPSQRNTTRLDEKELGVLAWQL